MFLTSGGFVLFHVRGTCKPELVMPMSQRYRFLDTSTMVAGPVTITVRFGGSLW